MNKSLKDIIENIENNYKLEVGDIIVEMTYSQNYKKFNECIINILEQKLNN